MNYTYSFKDDVQSCTDSSAKSVVPLTIDVGLTPEQSQSQLQTILLPQSYSRSGDDELPNTTHMDMGISVKWALSMSRCQALDNVPMLLNDSLLMVSLTHCGLDDCEFLHLCPLLRYVDLSYNAITHVPNTISELPVLEVLHLGYNRFKRLRDIDYLSGVDNAGSDGNGHHEFRFYLTKLHHMTLIGNPLCEVKQYRVHVLTLLLTLPSVRPPLCLTDVMHGHNLVALDGQIISDEERHFVHCRYFDTHATPPPPAPVVKSEEELAAEAQAEAEAAEIRRRQEVLRLEEAPYRNVYHANTDSTAKQKEPLWKMLQSLPGDQQRRQEKSSHRARELQQQGGGHHSYRGRRSVRYAQGAAVRVDKEERDPEHPHTSQTSLAIDIPSVGPGTGTGTGTGTELGFLPHNVHVGVQQSKAIAYRQHYHNFEPESLTCCVSILGRSGRNRQNTNSTRRLLTGSAQGSMARVMDTVGVKKIDVMTSLDLQRRLIFRLASTVSAVSLLQRCYRHYRFRIKFSLSFRRIVVRLQSAFRAIRMRKRWFRQLVELASQHNINLFKLDDMSEGGNDSGNDDSSANAQHQGEKLVALSDSANGTVAAQHHAGNCIRVMWQFRKRMRSKAVLRRSVLRYVYRRRYKLLLLSSHRTSSVVVVGTPGCIEFLRASLRFLINTNNYLHIAESEAISRVKALDGAALAAAEAERINYGASAAPNPEPTLVTDPKDNELVFANELGRYDYLRVNSRVSTVTSSYRKGHQQVWRRPRQHQQPLLLSLHQNPIPHPAVPVKTAVDMAAEIVAKIQADKAPSVPPSADTGSTQSSKAAPVPALVSVPLVVKARPPLKPTIYFSREGMHALLRSPHSKQINKKVNGHMARFYLHTGTRLWANYTDLHPTYDFRLRPATVSNDPVAVADTVDTVDTVDTNEDISGNNGNLPSKNASPRMNLRTSSPSSRTSIKSEFAISSFSRSVAGTPRASVAGTPRLITESRKLSVSGAMEVTSEDSDAVPELTEAEKQTAALKAAAEAEKLEKRRAHRMQRAVDAFNFYFPAGIRSSGYQALVEAATGSTAPSQATDSDPDSLLNKLEPSKSVEQRRLKLLKQRGMFYIDSKHYFLSSNFKPKETKADDDPYAAATAVASRPRSPLLGDRHNISGASKHIDGFDTNGRPKSPAQQPKFSSIKKTLAVRTYDKELIGTKTSHVSTGKHSPDTIKDNVDPIAADFDPYFVRGVDCNDPGVGLYVIHLRDGVDSKVLYYLMLCLTSLDRYISIANKLFSVASVGRHVPSLLPDVQIETEMEQKRDAWEGPARGRGRGERTQSTSVSSPTLLWDFRLMRMLAVQVVQRVFRGFRCRKVLFRKHFAGDDGDFISGVIRRRAAVCIQRCSRLRHGIRKRIWLLSTINGACRGIDAKNPVIYLDSWVYFLLLRYCRQQHPFIEGPGKGDDNAFTGLLLPDVSSRIRRLWPEFQGYPSVNSQGEGVLTQPHKISAVLRTTSVALTGTSVGGATGAKSVHVHLPVSHPETHSIDRRTDAALIGTDIKKQQWREYVGPNCCRLRIYRPPPPLARLAVNSRDTEQVQEAGPVPTQPLGTHIEDKLHPHPSYRRYHAHTHAQVRTGDHGFSRPNTSGDTTAGIAAAVDTSVRVTITDTDTMSDDDGEGEDRELVEMHKQTQLLNLEAGNDALITGSLTSRNRGASMDGFQSLASRSPAESLILIQEPSLAASADSAISDGPGGNIDTARHRHSAGSPRGGSSNGHYSSGGSGNGGKRPHTVAGVEAGADASKGDRSPRSLHPFTMDKFPSHPHFHSRHHPHSRSTNHSDKNSSSTRPEMKSTTAGTVDGVVAREKETERLAKEWERLYPCKLFDLLTKHVQSAQLKIFQPKNSSITAMGNILEHASGTAAMVVSRRHSTALASSTTAVQKDDDGSSIADPINPFVKFTKQPKYNVKAGALRVMELRFKSCAEARARMGLIILATFDGFRRKAYVPMSETTIQLRVNDNALMINAHIRPPPKKVEPVMPVGHIHIDQGLVSKKGGKDMEDVKVLENSILARSDNKFKSLLSRPLSAATAAAGSGSASDRKKGEPLSPTTAVNRKGSQGQGSGGENDANEPVVLCDTSIEPKILLQPADSYPRALFDCATRCAELPLPKEGDFESDAAHKLALMRGEIPASLDIQLFSLFCYVLSLNPLELLFMYNQLRNYLIPRGDRHLGEILPSKTAAASDGVNAPGIPVRTQGEEHGRISVLTLPGKEHAASSSAIVMPASAVPMFRLPPSYQKTQTAAEAAEDPLDDEIGDDWEQDPAVQARERRVAALTAQAADENQVKEAARAARKSKRRNTVMDSGGTGVDFNNGINKGSPPPQRQQQQHCLSKLEYESPLLYQDFQRLKNKEKVSSGLFEKKPMIPPPLPGAAMTITEAEAAASKAKLGVTGEATNNTESTLEVTIPEESVVLMRNSLLLWCSQLERGGSVTTGDCSRKICDGIIRSSEPEILSVQEEEKIIPKLPRSFHAHQSCYRMSVSEALVLASTVIEPQEFRGSQTAAHYTTFSEKKAEAEAHIKELERNMSLERLEVLNHYKLHKHRTQQKMRQRERQRVLLAAEAAHIALEGEGIVTGGRIGEDEGSSLESLSIVHGGQRLELEGENSAAMVVPEGTVDDLVRTAQQQACNNWPTLSPKGTDAGDGGGATNSNIAADAGGDSKKKSMAKTKHEAKLAYTREKNKIDRQELREEVELLRALEQQRREQSRAVVRTEEAKSLEYAAEQRDMKHQMAKLAVSTQEIDNAMKLEGRIMDTEERLEGLRQKKAKEDAVKAQQRDYRGIARDSCNILAQLARKEHAHAVQALMQAQLKEKQENIQRARLHENDSKARLREQQEASRLARRYGRPSSAGAPRRIIRTGGCNEIPNYVQLSASQYTQSIDRDQQQQQLPFDDSLADDTVLLPDGTNVNNTKARLSVHLDAPKMLPSPGRHRGRSEKYTNANTNANAHANASFNANIIMDTDIAGHIHPQQQHGLQSQSQSQSQHRLSASLVSPMMSGEMTMSWVQEQEQEQGQILKPGMAGGIGHTMTQEESMQFSTSLHDVSTADPLGSDSARGGGGHVVRERGRTSSSAGMGSPGLPQYSSSTVPTIPQVQAYVEPVAVAPVPPSPKDTPPSPFSAGTVRSGKAAINSYFAKQFPGGAGVTRRPATAGAARIVPGPSAGGAGAGSSRIFSNRGVVTRVGTVTNKQSSSLMEKSDIAVGLPDSLKDKSLSELVAPLSDLVAPYSEYDEVAANRGPVPNIRQYPQLYKSQRPGSSGGGVNSRASSGVVDEVSNSSRGMGVGFESTGSAGSAGFVAAGGSISSGSATGPGDSGSYWSKGKLSTGPGMSVNLAGSAVSTTSAGSVINLRPPSPNRGVPPSHTALTESDHYKTAVNK